MKTKIALFFFFLMPCSLVAADTLTLLFTGDVMMHQMQINAAKTPSGYAVDDCFGYIKPMLSEADISIVNFETTLAGAPYSGYPAFCAPDELAMALRRAGVDVALTANNHSCDKGKKGIVRTLKMLDSLKLLHTGTFYDNSHRYTSYPLLLKKHNITLGLLNYTYGTNGIPIPAPTVVNLIDTAQISEDIAVVKRAHADIIAVAIHWGEEYRLYPNAAQRMLSAFLHRKGVHLVIGSHPHVLQPMEEIYGADSTISGVTVYSLGNFISNQTDENTEIGALAHIRLVKQKGKTSIDKTSYSFTWAYKPLIADKRRFYVLPASHYENNPGFFTTREEYERMRTSLKAMRSLYEKKNIGFIEEK